MKEIVNYQLTKVELTCTGAGGRACVKWPILALVLRYSEHMGLLSFAYYIVGFLPPSNGLRLNGPLIKLIASPQRLSSQMHAL